MLDTWWVGPGEGVSINSLRRLLKLSPLPKEQGSKRTALGVVSDAKVLMGYDVVRAEQELKDKGAW